jgi:hypothetical protein
LLDQPGDGEEAFRGQAAEPGVDARDAAALGGLLQPARGGE